MEIYDQDMQIKMSSFDLGNQRMAVTKGYFYIHQEH